MLFIASADPDHVQIALWAIHARYPKATFDVIARHQAIAIVDEMDFCRLVHVTGTAQGRLRVVRRVRQTGYPTVAFIEAGSGGFVALQALALVSGCKTIVFADENGSVVRLGANVEAFIHVGNRCANAWGTVIYSTSRQLLRTILTPVGLIILLVRTAVIIIRRGY